jgi:hypothetical protein
MVPSLESSERGGKILARGLRRCKRGILKYQKALKVSDGAFEDAEEALKLSDYAFQNVKNALRWLRKPTT